ncbi:dethiobiotin synthase [Candidatus Nitronereus thalassa]|uniref:ATP-dependent dethiobiotin synthetase BioD n=1 Tax=Candidatus Nitronereus thalassa TaxID=3020898 RepID=A0ABU3K3T8_9BACT|nr:dethiobiotin synthase [Candidatus Nitronereus thalassa]MDT7041056.1 dethiobiotin synthase [Candidatus Nitronereus thalassa]
MSNLSHHNPPRRRSIFITGNDTGVGKTAVTAALGMALQHQGFRVEVMKPIETGVETSLKDPRDDASRLQSLFNSPSPPDKPSLYQYREPIAPLAASRKHHQPIDLSHIVTTHEELLRTSDFVLVEGAGGVMVPLTTQETVRDLIRHLQIPCIVVSRPTLGSVNHTLLSLHALRDLDIEVLGVVLNQSSAPQNNNDERLQRDSTIQLIRELSGTPVVGPIAFEPLFKSEWKQGVSKLASDPAITQLRSILQEKT